MKLNINIKKILTFLILYIAFFSGILFSFNSNDLYINHNQLIMIPIVIASIGLWLFYRNKITVTKSLLFKYLLFLILLSLILSLMRTDQYVFINTTLVGISIVFLRKSVSGLFDYIYPLLEITTLTASITAMILFSISNFNSQGVVYMFTCLMLLNRFIRKDRNLAAFIVLIILSVILISLTKSRTSMFAFLIVSILTLISHFQVRITIKNIIISIMSFLLFIFSFKYITEFFYNIFFNKWVNKDITSNRISIWQHGLDTWTFFGKGTSRIKFTDLHNTFLQSLEVNGVIFFIFLLIFIIILFLKIYRSKNKIYFANFFTAWVFVSCFENLEIFTSRLVPITFLFLIHIILLTSEKQDRQELIYE
ncbi:hypothetical protein [Aerococcus sp. UMB7834]|uniref:hypothetical protein n=1 Tax=Aerococcus sp. UMB7834 TaxID=3046342 RepID=UPI00254DBC58|nr:hypothetical protein [Aerococcus sp. UMB7834]MDK6805097.1 hypothetical protein [Aerococcus sp. UMB7834]